MSTSLMALFLEENSGRESNMDEVFTNGLMERFMMDNGKMGIKLVVECGRIPREKAIWANGKMIK